MNCPISKPTHALTKKVLRTLDHDYCEAAETSTPPPRRRTICCGDESSATRRTRLVQHEISPGGRSRSCTPTTTSNPGGRRAQMVSARSLSHSALAGSSCSCFAPLPEYAQYQERKTLRVLSRRCIFTEPSESACPGLESRQGKIVVSRDLVDLMTRQPPSPKRRQNGHDGTNRQRRGGTREPTVLSGLLLTNDAPKEEEDEAMVRHDDNSILCKKSPKQEGHEDDEEEDVIQHFVEVSPGITAVLRTAEETVNAIRNDFFVPCTCLFCTLDLFCIADAQFVVCPRCRVVSPLECGTSSSSQGPVINGKKKQDGLGLGLSYDSLIAIQKEIASSGS